MPLMTISAPGYYEVTSDLTQADPNDHAIYVNPGVHFVTIVLKARLVGAGGPGSLNCGIYAPYSAALNIVGMGGNIRGFQYGVRGDNNDLTHIRDLFVQDALFRGICIAGNDTMISDNDVRNVTGCTAYPDAFCFGIEVSGTAASNVGAPKVLRNNVQDCIGMGQGEGVGISITDKGLQGIVAGNSVHCTALSNPKANGESSGYGLWVGGNSDVVCAHNVFTSWGVGGAYSSPTAGFIDDNSVRNCTVPFMHTPTAAVLSPQNG